MGDSKNRSKFTIRSFRPHDPMDRPQAEQNWTKLGSAIDEIHSRNASDLSFEELYRNAYNLVLFKHGDVLYQGVASRLTSQLILASQKLAVMNEGILLEGLASAYADHRTTLVMVRDVLMYMDRTYVEQRRLRPVYELGLHLFHRTVWANGAVGMRACGLVLRSVENVRMGGVSDDPTLARRVLTMLIEIGDADGSNVYDRDFDGAFIDATQEFYRAESIANLAGTATGINTNTSSSTSIDENDSDDCNDQQRQQQQQQQQSSTRNYVKLATRRIKEEMERANELGLTPSTCASLVKVLDTELVARHANTLASDEGMGFAALLADVDGTAGLGSSTTRMGPPSSSSSLRNNSSNNNNNARRSGIVATDQNQDQDNHKHARLDEMRDVFDLFSRVPSTLDLLRDALVQRIKADGATLITDQENGSADPSSFVRGVLYMTQLYTIVVDYSFRAERKAAKRLREGLADFLNADARAASCLAVYVDDLLRQGLRGCSELEMERQLSNVVTVFRYLSDKDVFESYYKQHLAKRLLTGRSVGDSAERSMVGQLKAECGYQFTSKLEGMFNDMAISKDTRDSYKKHKREHQQQQRKQQQHQHTQNGNPNQNDTTNIGNGNKKEDNGNNNKSNATSNTNGNSNNNNEVVDIEVDVLTTGYWPSQNIPACPLPSPVMDAVGRFEEFYLKKHSGRKLSWQTSTGTAEIRATFGREGGEGKRRAHDGIHDLIVSTYQMCILMLFVGGGNNCGNDGSTNARNSLTLRQIREETQIPDHELRRHLVSLCTPKHRILRKSSKGKGIRSDDDAFSFNNDYTSRLKRVRIPLVSMKEAGPPSSGGSSSVSAVGEMAMGSGGGIGAGGGTDRAAASAAGGGGVAVPLSVEEDRRHLVEASIVRIMKARKTMHHNQLVAEVSRQLGARFKASPPFIKKRIESLIEREYIERTEGDRRVYAYVA